jgi:hypothetical protein
LGIAKCTVAGSAGSRNAGSFRSMWIVGCGTVDDVTAWLTRCFAMPFSGNWNSPSSRLFASVLET